MNNNSNNIKNVLRNYVIFAHVWRIMMCVFFIAERKYEVFGWKQILCIGVLEAE